MKSNVVPRVSIYTDGAAVPNPGPGGWAAILQSNQPSGGMVEKEISGSETFTTSIRMEIRAAVEGLSALKRKSNVSLYSDSRYLCNGAKIWLSIWKARNWQSKSGKEIKNLDLWQRLDVLMRNHQVEWNWIKGHSDNLVNQRADKLAHSTIPLTEMPLSSQEGYHLFLSVTCAAGIGGWGIVLRSKMEQLDYGGCAKETTANRLEIQAAIEGIKRVPEKEHIHLYTKNNYIYSAISHDIFGWKEKDWLTTSGKPVKNRDLWEQLLTMEGTRKVSWHLITNKNSNEVLRAHAIAKTRRNEFPNEKS